MGINPLLDFPVCPVSPNSKPEFVTPLSTSCWPTPDCGGRAMAADTPAEWDAFVASARRREREAGRAWGQVSAPAFGDGFARTARGLQHNLPKITIFTLNWGRTRCCSPNTSAEGAPPISPCCLHRARRSSTRTADFRLGGEELPDDKKARFMQVAGRAGAAVGQFERNILDATNDFALYIDDAAQLAGMPDDVQAMMKAAAEADAKTAGRSPLHMPSYCR